MFLIIFTEKQKKKHKRKRKEIIKNYKQICCCVVIIKTKTTHVFCLIEKEKWIFKQPSSIQFMAGKKNSSCGIKKKLKKNKKFKFKFKFLENGNQNVVNEA